jgi:hypothetical protein
MAHVSPAFSFPRPLSHGFMVKQVSKEKKTDGESLVRFSKTKPVSFAAKCAMHYQRHFKRNPPSKWIVTLWFNLGFVPRNWGPQKEAKDGEGGVAGLCGIGSQHLLLDPLLWWVAPAWR